jgi:hypothetical protein
MKLLGFLAWLKRLPLSIPASVFGAGVLFACLWMLGFPTPFVDDLALVGAALNMAAGGDFSNPLMTRQGFPSHYFFIQLPTHSYVLTGWLKIFGISTASLTAFQMTMYFLTAAATIAILRRHSAPRWLEWLTGPAVIACLAPCGLRMEPLAIALTMAGFAIIECGVRNRFAVALAFFLMFMGGSAALRTIFLPTAFVLLSIWRLARTGATFGRGLRLALISAAFTLAITVVLFLWMIDFRLNEFLTTIRFHTIKRVELDVSKWAVFLALLEHAPKFMGWPLLFLPFVVMCLNCLRRPRRFTELDGITTCLLIPFVLLALTGTITVYALWFPVFALLTGVASMLQPLSSGRKRVLLAVLALLLLVANKWTVITAFGVASGKIKHDTGPLTAQALAMRSEPTHKVALDSWIARYVFGYQIPPEFAAFEFCYPIGGSFVESSLAKGDIYLVSPMGVRQLEDGTNLRMPDPPMWAPLGVRRWAIPGHPCRVSVIRAEDCNGPKKGDPKR